MKTRMNRIWSGLEGMHSRDQGVSSSMDGKTA